MRMNRRMILGLDTKIKEGDNSNNLNKKVYFGWFMSVVTFIHNIILRLFQEFI